jgi:hypothetical protein
MNPSEGYSDDGGKATLSQYVAVEPLPLINPFFAHSDRVNSPNQSSIEVDIEEVDTDPVTEFRLYKRRFAGLVGLVCRICR